jgi:TatA/E family protein of Tat protein translocase
MFGSIGIPEMIVVFILVLLLFGPEKLPEIAKMIGKTVREFRSAMEQAKSAIEKEINVGDLNKDLHDIRREIKSQVADATPFHDVYAQVKDAVHDVNEAGHSDDNDQKIQ